jgi:hypothetical protein
MNLKYKHNFFNIYYLYKIYNSCLNKN